MKQRKKQRSWSYLVKEYIERVIPAHPSPTGDLKQWVRNIRSTTEAQEPGGWSSERQNPPEGCCLERNSKSTQSR